MNLEELISKALEIEQLQWWLKYPTLQSFYLRRGWGSSDEGEYWTEQEETRFILSTDIYDPEEFSEDDSYWDYENHSDFGVTDYPCKREGAISERICRPYPTDTEIQVRIDVILRSL